MNRHTLVAAARRMLSLDGATVAFRDPPTLPPEGPRVVPDPVWPVGRGRRANDCRHLDDLAHTCRDRHGHPIRPGGSCFPSPSASASPAGPFRNP